MWYRVKTKTKLGEGRGGGGGEESILATDMTGNFLSFFLFE